MKYIYIILSIGLLFCSNVKAQEIDTTSIENLFLEQLSFYPQEKIYVHTDRNVYLSGETIWFRAHIVDALFLKQANASRYIYIELINPLNDIVQRIKLKPDSTGCFYGNILLDEDLAEGNYLLRAYTRFMQNQGNDYFFHKSVYVTDPMAEKTNRSFERPTPDKSFHVAFFPEGGHAPFSADIKMAFKAINSDGLSEEIKGQIFDDLGQSYASFESSHLGMGYFRMYYPPERKFHAICTNNENVSKRFDLPEAALNAVSLNTIWANDYLRVSLTKSPDSQFPPETQLIAHIRGSVLYAQPWDEEKDYIIFEKDFFPAGIIHFLLTDKNRNILSERLVYSSQNSTFAQSNIYWDKNEYKTRDKVDLTIQITDENEQPLSGSLSIAIIDKKDAAIDTTSTIISTLLLSSELRGYIESPMSYLEKNNKKASLALDILMMTQGWRRYDIPKILKGELTRDLKYQVELSEEVAGKAEGIFSSLKEGSISLLAYKDSVLGTSYTEPDKKGNFVFNDLEYPEGTQYIIQALTQKGSKNAFLEISPFERFPDLMKSETNHAFKPIIKEQFISKMNEKYKMENGMRMYNLAEVVVTANRKIRLETESPYYSVSSSKVLTNKDVEKWNPLSVLDLLRRIPGITVLGDEVKYRTGVPMVILDNVPEENFDYTRIDVNDIKDVFVSPPESVASIFGSRAAGGAVIINTKRGFVEKNKMNKNMQIVKSLGYQEPVEFYSPAYSTKEEKNNTIPDLRSTIYWNPNLLVNHTGTSSLTFYSADLDSEYEVIIEGVSTDGHLIYLKSGVIQIRK
jgi:hypothetical protein